ncbi:InlB B-repeat-containing protein [Paenibacillus paeoniae]|uniref:SLH domain-containing protein n=1 Tax=Paenibacillus paeoniae TaxID=2292705 RepID=A0A371PH11_9BACL|nr:InlB B-repeat-containing protein [Paenibacillus paeoniae]REK74828.1 hypothetical protein DX130_14310 [Paenibacillus paeoniae]
MGKKFVSRGSMLLVIFCMAIIVFLNSQSVASANIPPTPIFASEDTTIIYEGINASLIYENGDLGYLDVGYRGTFGVPVEAQVLLKYDLPPIPAGYEIETASLYIPVSGGNLQPTTNFSLKISTSTNHSWTQDSNITSPPAPTSGSTQTRILANNAPLLKPTLAPFNFTSYIVDESLKANPKATFILSGMNAQEAASNGINNLEHYIQMTETNVGNGTLGPYLIISYSQLPTIEITGVTDGGLYNTNVTPQFNAGTATLNGSPFVSGTAVSSEGAYTLTVTAGSQQKTVQFRIDKTPPTGTIIVNLGNQYTNSSAVSISISPDAGVTDITHIQYSVNGNPFTQMPYVPSFMLSIGNNDGDKVLKFKLVDGAGNASIEYERTITRDTEVPTGSIVINNGNVYTTTSGVTLNLSLGNGVTDVVGVQFSDNNSSWSGVEAFSPIKSYTLPVGDGNKTVYVRLIDRADNITIIQDSIILDTTVPTGTVVVNNGSDYTNNANVYVNITPDAGVTDIASIRYSINGGLPTTIAYTSSFTIHVGSTDGLKAITLQLIDNAGNESPVYNSNVTLDTEPPTGTVAINGGATYATDQEVTLDFTLGADVTDVVSVQFSNDNLTWSSEQAYSASMSYTLPAGDGNKTVYVRFIDRAGNTGTAQASIVLDTTAPTGTITLLTPSITNSLHVSFTVSSSNADYMEFGETGLAYGALAAYSASPQSYTLQETVDGVKTLQVRLSDLAGNTTVLTLDVTLDRTLPTGAVSVNNGNAYTIDSNVIVDITPDAGVTDIANIRYSINGGTATTIAYTSSFQIDVGSTDGLKAITIRLIDHAGNESPVYSSNVTLDTEPPTGTVAINGGATYATDQEVTLDFTLGAGVTDVVSVQFSNDNLTWSSEQAFSASMSYTLPAGDGNKAVYVRFIDRAGNTGLDQSSITLDNTAPIVTGVADGESYGSLRTIAFNEGTATLNGNVFINGSTVSAEGSYVLIVTDEAGNSITITFSIFKYRVSYDGNGATEGLVPVDIQTYETGNTVSVVNHIGSLVKTGFTFIGWNTEADGSGTSYVANDTFTISTVNVTLYATWEMNHYTVSFESDGGNVVANQTKSYNEWATEPDVPTKSGFTFGGWYKEITLTNQWSFDNDRVTANTTLYAKWTANNSSGGYVPPPILRYTVHFETNGADVIGSLVIVNDSKLTELPTPVKEGFIFGGWYHDTALTQKWDYEKDRVTTNTTLYAKWIAVMTPDPKPVVKFKDISGHWAQEMIEELASQGIITGYADGSFKPNESIQRQHMALIFMRAFELEPVRELESFSDVSPNHANYEAIALLQQAGIVDGTNGRFNPSEPVTRAQMAKIVALALKIELSGTSPFQDVPSTHWSYAYVAALAELEILLGDNGKFNPDEPVTRAQFVAMMYRALQLKQEVAQEV